jgi:hypothetical protein
MHVDHVATFEMRLQASQPKQQVKHSQLEGGLFLCRRRSKPPDDQIVSMLFESFVDEFGAEFLFVSIRERGFAPTVSLPLSVGESSGDA